MIVLVRLDRVRAHVRAASLDALVVTHLPNVRYLTGFTGTAGALVLLPDQCLLVVDFRYVTAALELVASLPPGAIVIEPVPQTYDAAIVEVLRRESCRRIGIEAAWLSVSRFNAMSSGLAASAPTPLRTNDPTPVLVPTERLVERARMIKDTAEVAAIREGGRRISAIARRLRDFVAPGRREDEIAAELEAAMRAEGFSRPAFETIVASGPNSALPHARPTARRLEPGDSTVLDFGGVYDGYCVDLTRTVQLGPPGPGLQRLYEAVAKAHETAVAAVRPGVRPSAIDRAARGVLGEYGLAEAFGHGTGHGIGLEIHEDPRIGRETPGVPDLPVEPGMIFTIEPGAYVPGTGGVRIEDDVLVTADGCELLTDAPRSMTVNLKAGTWDPAVRLRQRAWRRMDFSDIERILDLVRQHDLAEFELEKEGLKVRVRKAAALPAFSANPVHTMPVGVPAPAPAATALPSPVPAAPPPLTADEAEESVELAVVKSPIVGTFYRSPEPGAPAFVEVGQRVKKDQVLCIIEAMKLMNEITSEYDGEIVSAYVENGKPVQYGERLFAIRTT